MTDQGWCIDDGDDEDDFWDEDDYGDEPGEPDYHCWTCRDTGIVQARTQEVNCPECRPTPRQRRREHLSRAWWNRRWDRQRERDLAASHFFDDEAPF